LMFPLVQQQDTCNWWIEEMLLLFFLSYSKHVYPGTVVHSDEWAAYSQISSAGYSHSSVNHSLHFVGPITCTRTQHMQFKVGSDSSGNLKNRVDRILKESLGSCTPAKCSGIVFFSSLDFDPVLHDPGIIFSSSAIPKWLTGRSW